MGDESTLAVAAPAAEAGQPAESQAAPAPSVSEPAESAAVASPASTDAQPQPTRLYAGKYKTPEEMEQGYAQSTTEALRLYQENQKLLQQGRNGNGAGSTTTPETYTEPQLVQFREHWQRKAFEAQAAGNTSEAVESIAKMNQCNDKLVDVRLEGERRRWQGQQATSSLLKDSQSLLKPYQPDLQPGSPLFEAASQEYNVAVQALQSMLPHGAVIPNELNTYLSTVAVLTAAAKTGKATAGVAQKARQEFAGAVTQAMKQAVVAGAGAAAKSPDGAPDFDNMSRDEFRKYQKSIGVA